MSISLDGRKKWWANGTKGKIESCEAGKYLAVVSVNVGAPERLMVAGSQ